MVYFRAFCKVGIIVRSLAESSVLLCGNISTFWSVSYTHLSGMSFNGGRIISTFAVPAIAGAASGSMGMMIIFYIAMAVFVAGSVVWLLLPETLNKSQE